MIPLLIGAGLGLGAAYLGYRSSQSANKSNEKLNAAQLALSREQFDYQKSLNERVMEREDTAYQRAVSDMQAAGLNPLTLNSGASASSLSAGSPMSAGSFRMEAPQFDLSSAIQSFISYDSNRTQRQNALLNNATSENIAQMQQRGVDMANAYNYEVGMANAYANQLKAITDYKRSGVNDPEVLKALKDQIKAEARQRESEANLSSQEFEGRSKSGNYRGMPDKVGNLREGEQYVKDKADQLTDIVNDATDDKTGLGKVKSGDNIFSKVLSAMNSANRGARKQASRQLLRGARRR